MPKVEFTTGITRYVMAKDATRSVDGANKFALIVIQNLSLASLHEGTLCEGLVCKVKNCVSKRN